jgi:hypothetical protein
MDNGASAPFVEALTDVARDIQYYAEGWRNDTSMAMLFCTSFFFFFIKKSSNDKSVRDL